MYLTNHLNKGFYNVSDIERMLPSNTRGSSSGRDDFERDYGRVVHSAAFRRLQAKTQVLGIGEGDFHRTRLTHSMEVSQIARGIVITLNENSVLLQDLNAKIDSSLVEAAALAHDFGHPPFGHQGERALNEVMQDAGGFEGNAQTFRILTRLERHQGLNLTRATLLAILKYPIFYDVAHSTTGPVQKPPKTSVYVDDKQTYQWLIEPFDQQERAILEDYRDVETGNHIKTKNKSLECSIIEIADDIAYATHDLEDALKINLIDIRDVIQLLNRYSNVSWLSNVINKFMRADSESFTFYVKDAISQIISDCITSIKLYERQSIHHPRLKYYAKLPLEIEELLKGLNELIKVKVIQLQRVQTMEWKGGHIVKKLFQAFNEHRYLLPEDTKSQLEKMDKHSSTYKVESKRLVCDYVAGMTDSFALTMYARLFESKESRLFDI